MYRLWPEEPVGCDRNLPCHCGSGKKIKCCCGAPGAVEAKTATMVKEYREEKSREPEPKRPAGLGGLLLVLGLLVGTGNNRRF